MKNRQFYFKKETFQIFKKRFWFSKEFNWVHCRIICILHREKNYISWMIIFKVIYIYIEKNVLLKEFEGRWECWYWRAYEENWWYLDWSSWGWGECAHSLCSQALWTYLVERSANVDQPFRNHWKKQLNDSIHESGNL